MSMVDINSKHWFTTSFLQGCSECVVDIHRRKLLWVYCPGHARMKGKTEQIDWRAKQPSQVACVSEDLKC